MTVRHRYPWVHTTRARRALDLAFDVQTTDAELGRYLDRVLGALPLVNPPVDEQTARLRFGLAEVPVATGRADPQFVVRRAHRLVRSSDQQGAAFQDLFAAINRATVRASARRVLVHSGLVGFGDHAVMLVGVSGSGKSSLTAMCCAVGAQYGTDEVTAIDPATGVVEGAARPILLKRSAPKALLGLLEPAPAAVAPYLDRLRPVTAGDLGAEAMQGPPRTVSIVFVQFAHAAPPASLVTIPRADAVAALISSCWNRAALGRMAFDAAVSLVHESTVARLEFSDCVRAAETIRFHFGNGQATYPQSNSRRPPCL